MQLLKYVGKIPSFNFETDVDLVPIGDMHIGNKNCEFGALNKYVNYVVKKDAAYACLMGDELEAEIPSYSGKWGYEQEYLIDEQLKKLYETFKPLADKKKILTKCSSTHVGWTKKLTGHDIDKEIARELGTEYIGIGKYWKINAKQKKYTMFQQHGSSGSKYPQYEILKAMESYPNADVYLLGHIHQLSAQPYTKRYAFGDAEYEKTIWGIRTGSFVGDKDWAREKLLPRPSIGAPIIHLNSDEYNIKVDIDSI